MFAKIINTAPAYCRFAISPLPKGERAVPERDLRSHGVYGVRLKIAELISLRGAHFGKLQFAGRG